MCYTYISNLWQLYTRLSTQIDFNILLVEGLGGCWKSNHNTQKVKFEHIANRSYFRSVQETGAEEVRRRP